MIHRAFQDIVKKYRKAALGAALACFMLVAGGVALTSTQSEGAMSAPALHDMAPAAGLEVTPYTVLVSTDLSTGLQVGRLNGITFEEPAGMRSFYEQNGFNTLWLDGPNTPSRHASTALGILETAWTHGLNPLTYHVKEIRAALEEEGVTNRYGLELLLSDAVIRYGRDLTGMRVNPAKIGQRADFWQPPMRGVDILHWVDKNRGDIDNALARLAPQGDFYEKLRAELVRTLTGENEGEIKTIRIAGNLRPGDYHGAVVDIRARLGVTYVPPEGTNYYDDTLARAVRDYQIGRGMKPDAIIGKSTLGALNKTREDKITQLVANLERQRWMDRTKPDKYVMVNIPSATLWAVEDGRTKLQMRVIVGRENRPTNSFKTEITGVRFNPTWTVPPTIKKEDYLPALIEDPLYLTKRGIEIIQDGQTIDPTTIDWAAITWQEANALTMRQQPGAGNPLGRIRVLMPNNYNIYLHDTNERSAFDRGVRTLSSGCIRVEEPERLADFILQDNQGWSMEMMQALFEEGRMRDVFTKTPMPVYLVYNTMWENDRRKLVFGTDLYDLDAQLMREIKAINGFLPPVNTGQIVNNQGFSAKSGLDYNRLNP